MTFSFQALGESHAPAPMASVREQQSLRAWTAFAGWLCSKDATAENTPPDRYAQELDDLGFEHLAAPHWLPVIATHVQSRLEAQVRTQALPRLLAALSACEAAPDSRLETLLRAGLGTFAAQVRGHLALMDAIATAVTRRYHHAAAPGLERVVGVRDAYINSIAAALLPESPVDLQRVLFRFFSVKLGELQDHAGVDIERLLVSDHGTPPPSAGGHAALQASLPPDPRAGLPRAWLEAVDEVSSTLALLRLQATCHEVATTVVREDLHRSLTALAKNWLSTHVLGAAEHYMVNAPLRLLRIMLPSMAALGPAALERALQQATLRLHFFVYDTIGRMYVAYMFEIMMDYPESAAAVADCAECMQRTNLHQHFADSLLQSITRRLLHPGVATENILDGYINAIKVLQCIDKNGVLVGAVTEPIKHYLRSRPDTIRCVVKMLTQENADAPGESLLSDMRASMDAAGDGVDYDDLDGPEAVLMEATRWAPTSIELDNAALRGAASFDIISTLVDIYGDSLFVSEYKRMLGSKLMKKADFVTDFETQTLELLKLRFAESELHHCDVMLKDMQVSRRHYQSLVKPETKPEPALLALQPRLQRVSALICSHLFWPTLPNHDLQLNLPDWLLESTRAHAQAFNMAKNPRKLHFAPALGVVDLEVAIGGATLAFSVSPILAVIILQFQDAEALTAAQLSKATNIPLDLLLRKALFWVQHGALSEARLPAGSLLYRRNERLPDNVAANAAGSSVIVEDPEEEDLVPARRAQAEPEHDCEAFLHVINNILQSSKQCTLERMHKLLTLFCTHLTPKYDKSEDDLLEFLDALVERGHLKCEGSLYRLNEDAAQAASPHQARAKVY